MAAVAAHEERGVGAAVEEEDGLLAPLEGADEPLAQVVAQDAGAALAVPLGQVADEHLGKPRLGGALGEGEQGELVALGLGVALDAGGGGAEDDRAAVEAAEGEGHLLGVVAGRGLLLVGLLVLLVDHHEAEVREGREEGGARAEDDGDLARLDAAARWRAARRQARSEWSTATRLPNRSRRREMAWAARAISGTT